MLTWITFMNKLHFPIEIDGYVFPPREEVQFRLETNSTLFQKIRTDKRLRINKSDNENWLKKSFGVLAPARFNMVYDSALSRRSFVYKNVIDSLAKPITKHLPESSFVSFPLQEGINLRFFSEKRIIEQGKYLVGPKDVFMSHGIGDKDYWTAENIKNFNFVLVPGPAWEEKIRKGGYKGEIFVTGYTKLDPIFQGQYKKTERKNPYIVWAPTHAYYNRHQGRSSYPECLELIKEISHETKIAFHPANRIKHHGNTDVTLQEIVDADVVIADAGSTIYESWALGKPVIFPDWICKGDILARFDEDNLEYQIYEKEIGRHAKDIQELNRLVDEALSQGQTDAEKEFIEKIFPYELRGIAGKTAAKALFEIEKFL